MPEGEINDDISQGASIPIQNTSESDGQIKTMEHQMSIEITEMLNQLPSNDHNPKSYISRVHSKLRKVKEKAYEPVLVSIGPYHYGRRKEELQFMERHKLRYLDDLMKRREKKQSKSKSDQLREYVKILGELEDQARSYYEETFALEKVDFLRMLLFDACFIIELLQRATWSHYEPQTETDPLFKANWIIEELKRDLLLVENQIPFFVMERLNKIIGDIPDPLALIFMAVNHLPIYKCIANDLQEDEVAIAMQSIVDLDLNKVPFTELPYSTLGIRKLDRTKLEGFKHLLDLTRKFMLIEEILEKKDDKSTSQPKQDPQESDKNTNTPANYKKTYSATELWDLGVTFKGVENRKFYEIKFDNGVLEIPVFNIDDSTETRFRNLVAYEEQGHCQGETIYIGNYMTFMGDLINTARDVKLLRRYGIIEGYLDNDEKIATMFNNMAKNLIPVSYHYYGEITQKIRLTYMNKKAKFTRRVWNFWMENIKEKLMWNFVHAPWKIISVIAAIVLLVLTITQTVYSVRSYKKA